MSTSAAIDDARRRHHGAEARVLPHNLEAEDSLLGAMLLREDAVAAAVRLVGADDFYKPAHARIFEAIRELHARGKLADPVTVADELRRVGCLDDVGGAGVLISLQAGTPTIGGAAGYAEIVRRDALDRRLALRAEDVREAVLSRIEVGPALRELQAATAARAALDQDDAARRSRVDGASFVDWAEFWARDRREADWLFDDVLARGRGHAIYAGFKTGKSLFTLSLAAHLVLRGVAVVYLDFEMGEDDLYDRLSDMGYGADTDLSCLHYAVLPSLPPLDTELGSLALFDKVDAVQAIHPEAHVAVIIDTTARAVAGEENSADTYRDFYRFTGLGLKQREVTWARLDHSGKDKSKGQRGSSAKGDDVDIVWRLVRTDNGIELQRDASRMGWVSAKVAFRQMADPLRFVRIAEDWPAGTAEVARILDDLGVDIAAGERPAGQAMRDAGHHRTQQVVRAAQKYRRQVAAEGAR